MACLRQLFPSRLIYQYGDLPWPDWSPDLTVQDFFSGAARSKGYTEQIQDITETKGIYKQTNP